MGRNAGSGAGDGSLAPVPPSPVQTPHVEAATVALPRLIAIRSYDGDYVFAFYDTPYPPEVTS